MKVAPAIWQFGTDYPGSQGDDTKLPIRDVLIKAFDEVYWMSKFDKHGAAVSGPAQIAKLVSMYKAQGIGVYLWCVPKNRNVATQLKLAKACLDVPGVKGLYMDVEPYAGFCNADCVYLADTFMAQLRAARPKAYLGVIYDPRPQHWARSGTTRWLKHANAAAPMCYWVSFAGQDAWAGAASNVRQAAADLRGSLGFRGDYTPMLQGNASGTDLQQAAQRANTEKATLVTIWRRGVVTAASWGSLASVSEPPMSAPIPEPSVEPRIGAYVKWSPDPTIYVVGRDGARHSVTNPATYNALGAVWKPGNDAERAMPIGVPVALGAIDPTQVTQLQAAIAIKDAQIMELEPQAKSWKAAQAIFRGLVSGHH